MLSFIENINFLGTTDFKPDIHTDRQHRNTAKYFFQGGDFKNKILYIIFVLMFIIMIIVIICKFNNLYPNQNLHKYMYSY